MTGVCGGVAGPWLNLTLQWAFPTRMESPPFFAEAGPPSPVLPSAHPAVGLLSRRCVRDREHSFPAQPRDSVTEGLVTFISRFALHQVFSQLSYLILSLPPRQVIVLFPFNRWGNGRSKKVHILPVYSQQPSALELSSRQSPFRLAFPFILKAQHAPLLQEQADQTSCCRRTENSNTVPIQTPRPISLLTPCI